MDSTLQVRVIKKAEPVCFAGDIEFPVVFSTGWCDESMRWPAKESRDFFDLVILDPDPAFAETAVSTSLAFEGFHQKCLKSRKAKKAITKTRKWETTKEKMPKWRYKVKAKRCKEKVKSGYRGHKTEERRQEKRRRNEKRERGNQNSGARSQKTVEKAFVLDSTTQRQHQGQRLKDKG
jgi:hypothetical protein